MQITYELNEQDLKAYTYYALKKHSNVKKARLFNYLFIFAISYWQLFYAVFFRNFLSYFSWPQFFIYFGIGTFTFVFVLAISKAASAVMRSIAINSSVKKHKYGNGILGEHLIRFEEDHLTEITDVNETRHSWKGIDRIEQDRDYIFIFTSPVNAHIIPKRFFETHESVALFVGEANRLQDAAKMNFSPSYLAANS